MPGTTGIKEPTFDEFQSMSTLNDIFTWAKLKGSVEYAESQVGSFLLALGADDDVTIDEFASIPVANVSRVIDEVWLHSKSNDPSDGLNTELIVKPTEFIKARAMSAHHVARIWAGFVDSRAVSYTHLTLPTKRIV